MKQVKCVSSCHFSDLMFTEGRFYPIIEEYAGMIAISENDRGYWVFSSGEFEDCFLRDYRKFFVKV